MGENICFIDFETTGLNPIKDYAIEVGAILVSNDLSILKKFQSYIKPEGNFKIDEVSFSIHGISEQKLGAAPSENYVLENFFNTLGTNYKLAAWNMSFDISFFRSLCYRNSIGHRFEEMNYRHIDVQTISLVAKGLGHIPSNISSLSELSSYFGFERPFYHSAIDDTELLFSVYKKLIELLKINTRN